MIQTVIEYILNSPVTQFMIGGCLMLVWGYLNGLFAKSDDNKDFHYIIWGSIFILGLIIHSSVHNYSISDYTKNLVELRDSLMRDYEGFGVVIVILIGGVTIMYLVIGILTITLTTFYLIGEKIFNIPFIRIKINYRRLLRSIDFLILHSLETYSFKQKCSDFKSINSLPFNFDDKFFINPRIFDRKREGKMYSEDRYKNIQEYSEESNWRNKVTINRVNYLKVFSNISTSNNMLKFQYLINYLYIPLTIVFSIIEYRFFNYLFCLPILFSTFYFFIKKRYPKDFKNAYYKFNTDTYILSAVLYIPILGCLNYLVQKIFIIRTYENDLIYWDLGFTLIILFFILLSDVYDYVLEKYMNSIFCRILVNEKLFCYFYSLNCFSVHLEEWVKIDDDLDRKEKKWFYIKHDSDIDI